jgi:hypothetical protein
MFDNINGTATEYEMFDIIKGTATDYKMQESKSAKDASIFSPDKSFTFTDSSRLCGTCKKSDVCKYKEDTMKLVEEIALLVEGRNDNLRIPIQCDKWDGRTYNYR